MAGTDAPGGGAEDGVVRIDITGLGKPAGAAARSAMLARAVGLYLGLFVLSLLWAGLILYIVDAIGGDGSGAGEAIALVIGLPLGFGPFLYGAYWILTASERWTSGVGSFIAAGDFGVAELARTIPHLGITLKDLLESVNGFAASLGAARVVRETNPAKVAQAWLLRAGAVAVLVAGVILGVTTGSPNYVPPVIAFAVFSYLLLKARKLLQPSLETVLAADKRKPVLLLRSFQDDMLKANQRYPTPIGDISLQRRFEQGIAGSLGAFGPLIAIGKPGEELPQIGAARAYLTEAEWQPAVLRWMDEALFIAMIAGPTEWIRWELHRIVERGRMQHLFVVLPPVADKARWDNLLAALAETRWRPSLATLDIRGMVLVQLRPDGRVVAIRREGGAPFIQDYQLAIAIALYEEFCRKPG